MDKITVCFLDLGLEFSATAMATKNGTLPVFGALRGGGLFCPSRVFNASLTPISQTVADKAYKLIH